jgi:hypothetical protein
MVHHCSDLAGGMIRDWAGDGMNLTAAGQGRTSERD